MEKMQAIEKCIWEIPATGSMKTPIRVYANERILKTIDDQTIQQAKNVSSLPGIAGKMQLFADAHVGYGMPVGGTAAFDAKEGIISPGAVGYDINCLPAGTKVLHALGYTRNIEDFAENWQNERITGYDWPTERTNTRIVRFWSRTETEKLIRIVTESGKEIMATRDHPFFTKEGKKEAGNLQKDWIAITGFSGVDYSVPADSSIVSEEDIKKIYPKKGGSGLEQVLSDLKKKELLPLRQNSLALPILAKICGFVQGDGTLHFLKGGGAINGFYGKKGDLIEIQKDLKALGFSSGLYSRIRKHKIKTSYETVHFILEELSLQNGSRGLTTLLSALGCTIGNKTKKEFEVPAWVFNAPLWIKRLYLAAFFGAELSSPKTMTNAGYNFYSPTLSMNKKQEVVANGYHFMEQLQQLLSEFGVKSSMINERKEFVNEKGEVSIRLRLQISSEPNNLIRFWSSIGFEYDKKKSALASAAVIYLKLKQLLIETRTQSISVAQQLKKDGLTLKEITARIGNKFINERFVARSIWEPRKTPVRPSYLFETFSQFFEERTQGLEQSGQVWEKIIKTEEVPFYGTVYDFTVENNSHNFVANGFTVSNCGMRLLTTNLAIKEAKPRIRELMELLFKKIPVGVGRKGLRELKPKEFEEVMVKGAKWCVQNGYGWKQDLERMEEKGCIRGADPEKVSQAARERGANQLGTLGSGNHYLEIQLSAAKNIFDAKKAKAFGLTGKNQIVAMIHSGSRGFGHQVCTDYGKTFLEAMPKYGIRVPDRDLACAPFQSEEGQDYYAAMACAANNAFANRQMIMHRVRESFESVFKRSAEEMKMRLVYDVAHNIVKLEKHRAEGKKRAVLVHRKGSTRSFGPGEKDLPKIYQKTGQPVIVGGSMETGSYLCVGTEKAMRETFGSTLHGSGRTMSRQKAKQEFRGEKLQEEMLRKGIFVKAASMEGLAEEAGKAYKNINDVIESMHAAGISLKVAALQPIGNIKG